MILKRNQINNYLRIPLFCVKAMFQSRWTYNQISCANTMFFSIRVKSHRTFKIQIYVVKGMLVGSDIIAGS